MKAQSKQGIKQKADESDESEDPPMESEDIQIEESSTRSMKKGKKKMAKQ